MALTYHNNNSISNITSFPLVPSGSPVLLSTATASGSSSISFTSGIDSTYDVYYFEFIDIHPSSDNKIFEFNLSTDSGSNYNVTKTSTFFRAMHSEADTTVFGYDVDYDLAQSTSFQTLSEGVGSDNDQATSGTLTLYNPSSTTYVKHFIANVNTSRHVDSSSNFFTAGYGNTTSAINAIRFQMNSGNIDAGTIKMYGIGAN